jgi:RNase H-fold protein (predicted Holliday junction resolvase)
MSDDDPIKTAKSTPLNTDIVELLQELENGDGVVWDERTEPVTVTEELAELYELEPPREDR